MAGSEEYVRDFQQHRSDPDREDALADAARAEQDERHAQVVAALVAEATALLRAARELRLPPSHGAYRAGALGRVSEVARYWRVEKDVFLGTDGVLYGGTAQPLTADGFAVSPVSRRGSTDFKGTADARKAARLARQHGLRGAVADVRPLPVTAARQSASISRAGGWSVVLYEGRLTWESSSEGAFDRRPLALSLTWTER